MRKYLLWIVFLSVHFSLKAQEPPIYSQFFMNPYIYNPAYAGVDGHAVVSVMHRIQWAGFGNTGPTISHVTFHTPLKGGIGIGAFVFNESFGDFLDKSGVKASVSYLVNFDRKHWLRFGLSLGAESTRIDMDQIDNPFDPAFANLVGDGFQMLGDFGVTFHSGHFNFGVSLPNLFTESIFIEESFSDIKLKPYDNVFLKTNYSIGFLNDDFVWEPHILYRYSRLTASQFEVANIIHVAHHIWFGASYRQDAGLIGLFGIKVKERLAIGYAFELGDSEVNSFTGNTHEIHIGFHISKKEHHGHASSFIKRHRKSAGDRRDEAEKRRLARMEALKGNTPKTNQNALLQTTEEDKPEDTPPVEELPDQTDNRQVTKPDRTVDQTETVDQNRTNNIANQPNNNQTQTPITNNPVDQTLTEDRRTPDQLAQSDKPLRVRSGTHMLELAPGNYVINGAFQNFSNAEEFSDKLFERGFHDVIVGYVSATGYYYVVVNKSETEALATSSANRLRGREGFEKIWVLTVE